MLFKTRNSQLAPRGFTPLRGLTLVEMLISMAVTLLMMAAVVNLFANIGAGVRTRRASMELGSELRQARARLFKDLAGATAAARPKLPSDDHDDGYLEIVEGEYTDKTPGALVDGNTNNGEIDYDTSILPSSNVAALDQTDGGGLGDYDDILALTVRSESEPFVGRYNNISTNTIETIESDLAEIIWYAVENPADGSLGEPGMRTVYRRVLLIAPWVQENLQVANGSALPADLLNFYRNNDISVHREPTGSGGFLWVPNTLSDLTKRENRFAHFLDVNGNLGFPFAMNQSAIRATSYDPSAPPLVNFGPLRPQGEVFDGSGNEARQGEDVMLNDVLAFDLRVFDPGAPLFDYLNQGFIVEPSPDAVFDTIATQTPVGYGAFVDLGWDNDYDYNHGLHANAPAPNFQEERRLGWHPRDNDERFRGNPCVYDTWPYLYENDGIDQDNAIDGNAGIDQGTNGLDDSIDGALPVHGVDDALERETAPPYDVPLRGMQAKIRVYDRDSRQIREATVTRNFVPQ